MAKPKLTSSASLHHRLGAFGALFAVLATAFPAPVAFALAIMASVVLSEL